MNDFVISVLAVTCESVLLVESMNAVFVVGTGHHVRDQDTTGFQLQDPCAPLHVVVVRLFISKYNL